MKQKEDLESIFLEIVNECDLNFNPNKEENNKRIKDGINEIYMDADSKDGIYLGFSSEGLEIQNLNINHEPSDQYLVLFLNKNGLTTIYSFSDKENLIRFALSGKNKKIRFLEALIKDTKKDLNVSYRLMGVSTENQEFNYQETKELVNLFMEYASK